MSQCYADRVEVLRRNDEPAHFLWRSRLYVVRGVLAHWVETGELWQAARVDVAVEPAALPAADAVAAAGRHARQADLVADRVVADVPAGLGGRRRRAGSPGGPGGSDRAGVGPAVAPSTTAVVTRERGAADPEAGPPGTAAPRDAATGIPAVPPTVPETGTDREVWRVEASCGRGGVPGVYDLSLGLSSGAWTLVPTGD